MDDKELVSLGADEIVIRLQDGQGVMRAFAVSSSVMADRLRWAYPQVSPFLPPMIRTLVDGFFFGLRHGPMQKILKAKGIEWAFDKTYPNKDAEALAAIFRVLIYDVQQMNEKEFGNKFAPIDLTQKDIADVYKGSIRRVPEYDGMALDASMESPEAIPEPVQEESFDYAEPTTGS